MVGVASPALCRRFSANVRLRTRTIRALEPLTASALSHTSAALCYGFNGPLQAVRDTTQQIFYSFGVRATLLLLVVGALASIGNSAWVAGRRYREISSSAELRSTDFLRLFACVAIDLVGLASFGVGEYDDIFWAPISAYMLRFLFRSDVVAAIGFTKELLPLTDILPVASLSWLLETAFPESSVARALGLSGKRGSYVSRDDEGQW
ncbi:hypothetical protein AB1Y20_004681 [Prymnesium parvum]|uniref:Uncharacterized protein n=1 Tax=Prymnesium parvum TaxID=97485 RepID=A0AB34IZS5_PRYPA